jgi:hypothetical protein
MGKYPDPLGQYVGFMPGTRIDNPK